MITPLVLCDAVLRGVPALGRLAAAVMKRVKQAREIMRHRREAAMLASFNDRMLSDIGLTRGDLNDAFAEPPWRDPTAVLVTRARERRAARRRAASPDAPMPPGPSPSIVPPDGGCDAGPRPAAPVALRSRPGR